MLRGRHFPPAVRLGERGLLSLVLVHTGVQQGGQGMHASLPGTRSQVFSKPSYACPACSVPLGISELGESKAGRNLHLVSLCPEEEDREGRDWATLADLPAPPPGLNPRWNKRGKRGAFVS